MAVSLCQYTTTAGAAGPPLAYSTSTANAPNPTMLGRCLARQSGQNVDWGIFCRKGLLLKFILKLYFTCVQDQLNQYQCCTETLAQYDLWPHWVFHTQPQWIGHIEIVIEALGQSRVNIIWSGVFWFATNVNAENFCSGSKAAKSHFVLTITVRRDTPPTHTHPALKMSLMWSCWKAGLSQSATFIGTSAWALSSTEWCRALGLLQPELTEVILLSSNNSNNSSNIPLPSYSVAFYGRLFSWLFPQSPCRAAGVKDTSDQGEVCRNVGRHTLLCWLRWHHMGSSLFHPGGFLESYRNCSGSREEAAGLQWIQSVRFRHLHQHKLRNSLCLADRHLLS